jgi:hypothetical protein
MGRALDTPGEIRDAYKILVRKSERRKPLVRPRCRRQEII